MKRQFLITCKSKRQDLEQREILLNFSVKMKILNSRKWRTKLGASCHMLGALKLRVQEPHEG